MTEELNNKSVQPVELKNVEKKEVVTEAEVATYPDQTRWRRKFKESNEKLLLSEARVSELETKFSGEIERISKNQKISESKRIEAEIKAAAVSEGLQDIDLIKVMDLSKVTVTEEGDIQGVQELISEFKSKKPHFFGQEKKINSSLNIALPGNGEAKKVNYLEMSNEEFKKKHAYKFY